MDWSRSQAVALGLAAALALLPAAPSDASRLFGTAPGIDGIFELNPQTGEVINLLETPPQFALDGLAFDGQSLWFIGQEPNTLYQLDPDTGQTRNVYELPVIPSTPENNNSGVRGALAYLNGQIYITNWDLQVQDIEVFDIAQGRVVRTLDIDGTNPGVRRFANSGLAALDGPDQLIVSTALTQEVQFIDPYTGVITSSFTHNQFGVLGIAVVDGELYLGSDQVGPDFDGIENIHVYTRGGVQLRTITLDGTNGIHSLAGDDTAIPEPGSAALLALVGLTLFRRRRR